MLAVWKITPMPEAFRAAADALLLRLGEKKVLEEGNDRFLDFHHRRDRDPDDVENRAL